MGRLLICALAACLCQGQPERSAAGTTPKASPGEYAAHAAAGPMELAADFLVRSFSGRGKTFIAGDYLVVEVAVYPPRPEAVLLSSGHFTLRVNGKKQRLFAQAPGMVAASLKYADWENRPSLQAGAGMGDAGVIIGRPPRSERFPGDPVPAQSRLPRPPRAPDARAPGGIDREEPVRAEDVAIETALPEGETRYPVSGHLYFAWKGKPASIKELDLLYEGPAGKAILRLR